MDDTRGKLVILKWCAAALFTLLLALSAAVNDGAHYKYAMSGGVGVSASLEYVSVPESGGPFERRASWQGPMAAINYQRTPNEAPRIEIPVSWAFYRRYKSRKDVPIAIHFLPGSILRPVIDEDPPQNPWAWSIEILCVAAGLAFIVWRWRRDYDIVMSILDSSDVGPPSRGVSGG